MSPNHTVFMGGPLNLWEKQKMAPSLQVSSPVRYVSRVSWSETHSSDCGLEGTPFHLPQESPTPTQ